MEQDKIWEFYQNSMPSSFDGSLTRLKYLVENIEKNKRVLNIGVGNGLFEKLCLKNNIDIYALDPSHKAIDKLKNVLGEKKAIVGYSQKLPFECDFFDYVVMSEVLEHLSGGDLTNTLKEISRVLKKDGVFIGTVPYKENLNNEIVICPKCGYKFHRWGHVQSFDEKKMYRLLSVFFYRVDLKPILFISWNTLNWKGKIYAFTQLIAYLLKLKKSGLNLYFRAKNKK